MKSSSGTPGRSRGMSVRPGRGSQELLPGGSVVVTLFPAVGDNQEFSSSVSPVVPSWINPPDQLSSHDLSSFPSAQNMILANFVLWSEIPRSAIIWSCEINYVGRRLQEHREASRSLALCSNLTDLLLISHYQAFCLCFG